MAWAPLVAAGVSAVGSLVGGIAQHGQANAQARVAGENADIAEDQASAQADAIREKARRSRGTNLANIGASGVTIDGSFADALTDSDINSELDARTALWNGEVAADNQRSQAASSRSSGNAALFGGVVNAGSAALSGYGSWKLLQAYGGGGAAVPSYGVASQASRNGY